MQKILFVGHEASRTGAPIALLHIIRWLKINGGVEPYVLLLRGGPLVEDYARTCPTTVLHHPGPAFVRKKPATRISTVCYWLTTIVLRIWGKLRGRIIRPLAVYRYKKEGVTLVYLNSVCSLQIMRFLKALKCQTLAHIHELPTGIACGTSAEHLATARESAAAFITVSKDVFSTMEESHGFPKEKLHLIPESVPIPKTDRSQHRRDVRAMLGLPESTLLVGMAGTLDLRKGTDLFIRIARKVLASSSYPEIHFIWVGDGSGTILTTWRKLYGISDALASKIHFVGEQRDAEKWIGAFDILTLTSREDPCPLVHIEAAMAGVPIVCFSGTGGATEWVGQGAGFVVPHGDVSACVEKVNALISDPKLREAMGNVARSRAQERFDIEKNGPQFLRILQEVSSHAITPVSSAEKITSEKIRRRR